MAGLGRMGQQLVLEKVPAFHADQATSVIVVGRQGGKVEKPNGGITNGGCSRQPADTIFRRVVGIEHRTHVKAIPLADRQAERRRVLHDHAVERVIRVGCRKLTVGLPALVWLGLGQ